MSAKTTSLRFVFLTLLSCLPAIPAKGAAILEGTVSVSYDQTAFASLGLTVIDSFNQASSNSETYTQILANAGTSTSWDNIDFGINPTTALPDPTDRDLQETSLTYDPGDLTGTVTGQIGIGGNTRWGGAYQFVLGDYGLAYDVTRAGGGYSGWYLTNNFGFPALAFDLANVTTTILPSGFTLSGDLYVKTGEPLNAFFGFAGEMDYGNFSMSASTVPEPATGLLVLVGGALICHHIRRRNQA